jgi:general secretion pathway protein D
MRKLYIVLLLINVAGCAHQAGKLGNSGGQSQSQLELSDSYLKEDNKIEFQQSVSEQILIEKTTENRRELPNLVVIESMSSVDQIAAEQVQLQDMFPLTGELKISVENMALEDFLHYVFGELLKVSYVFDQSVKSLTNADSKTVTLSLVDSINQRETFRIAEQVLASRDVQIKYGDGVFYIFKPDEETSKKEKVFGVGRSSSQVPVTSKTVVQLVPIKYGIKIALERNLRSFLDARVVTDYDYGMVFITGTRDQVLKGLELIELLDVPTARGKHIGFIQLTYVDAREFSEKVKILLENEGINATVDKASQSSLSLVPMEKLGGIAVFSSSQMLLQRVSYWSSMLDVPQQSESEQYFVYNPEFARAIDLGESISALLNLGSPSVGGPAAQDQNRPTTGNAPSDYRMGAGADARLRMVVDERSNSLVFLADGAEYRALLPLLRRLDVLPKQVSLDISIAEVTLQDEFKFGVEWALSRGEVVLTTDGAFNVGAIGGAGILINGKEGPLNANFLGSNDLVKVLSNPTFMVRDGVTAEIQAGSDISVIGATTQDPISGERQTTSSEYRQTGLNVKVTPTVNSKGVVVMEVSIDLSNSVPSSSGASGNPDIFERAINTEVVAKSGQTVLLGGLISETLNTGDTGTPGLAKIPLLGNLFKATSRANGRTELVILITPKILDDPDSWNSVKENFQRALNYIR